MPNDEQLSRSRSSKPMMEKRRRARINDSLLQLKNLVLDALNKNNPRHSKLEKADILEMTVRYLQSIHRQQLSGMAPPNEQANMAQYQSGYEECMHEVSRYLNASSNTNNASDGAIILHNLTTKEVTERQMQASLLNHLVSHCTDHNTEADKMAIPEQKTVAFTPRLVGSNTIPTLQFYASNQTPSMTSVNPRDVPVSRMKEETGREGRRGAPNPVLSSSVYSDGACVATVDPPACPTVNPAEPTTSEGITVVLPRNLVYSGQIPTHVIPIYAANSPIVSQAPLQPATVLSNVPSFSASTPLMLTPVAPGNVHASHSLGSAVAPVNGRFAFIPTPPPSANLFPSGSPMVDSSDKPMQSVISRQPTVTEETYLAELKSRDSNLHLPPSLYPVSSSVSSSSPPAESPSAAPVTTSQSTLMRTTTIKQSSLSLSHSHPKLPPENTSTPDVTQPSPNQNIFRSVAPSKTNMSPKVPLLGPAPTPGLHSNDIAPLAYQQSVTSAASSTPSHTPDSVNYSSPPKRQCVTISQVTEQSGVRHITPLAPRPPTKFNQYVNAIGVSRLDTPTTLTRCRSPHRFHSTRRDRPTARRAPQLSDDDPCRHDRNERYDVSQSGVSPKVAWRPW